mgnify:CR=1 FL=1
MPRRAPASLNSTYAMILVGIFQVIYVGSILMRALWELKMNVKNWGRYTSKLMATRELEELDRIIDIDLRKARHFLPPHLKGASPLQ